MSEALDIRASRFSYKVEFTADYLEGYTDDAIERNDTVEMDFAISSAQGATQTVRKMYLVTHAHPESVDGRRCTWFMAMPPNTAD